MDFSSINEAINKLPFGGMIVSVATSIILGLLLLWIGKAVFGLFHRNVNINHELVEKDNLAFSITYVGYFVGLLMCIGGVLVGESHGFVEDIIAILSFGTLGILLLNVSQIINDKFVLNQFSIKEEVINEQNIGTAILVAAHSLAVGFVVMGAITGEGGSILTTLGIWAISQVLLIITTKAYSIFIPYNLHEEVKNQNVAVALGAAGATIAVGYLINFSTQDNFESWGFMLLTLAEYTGAALVVLPIVRWAADKTLLPGRNLTDELVNQEVPNVGAGLVEAFAYLGGAILVSWALMGMGGF